MKCLRANANLRAVVVMLMLVVWSSQILDARQVSSPNPGMARSCEAERDDRIRSAFRDYLDASASISRKKYNALVSCEERLLNVDTPDCSRRYDSDIKTALAIAGTGTLTCGAVCVVVATPAGAAVAPGCATCIAGLYAAGVGGVVNAVTTYNDCIQKAKDSANLCVGDATRNAEGATADAIDAYDRKVLDAMNLFKQCKAGVGR